MRAVKGKNTKPEMIVRRLAHGMGYRYRLHRKDLPGRPDIAFPGRRKIIEVRGCFWHQHPDPACRNSVVPVTRVSYWRSKLERNVERDARNIAELQARGWDVSVIWECQLSDRLALANRVLAFLGPSKVAAKSCMC